MAAAAATRRRRDVFAGMIIFHFHAAVHLFCLSLFLTAPPRLRGQITVLAAHEKHGEETVALTETFNFLAENLPHVALFHFFFLSLVCCGDLFIMFQVGQKRLKELLRIKVL